MDEIILKAKAGPPVSRLVGNHVEVTKGLVDASIVEKHANRRITGKQSLTAAMVRRELIATVKAAKKKTKKEGKKLMDEAVNGMAENANKHGATIKANHLKQLKKIAAELLGVDYESSGTDGQTATLQRVMDILRANGA
jgi:hypothetical protein